MVRQKHSRYLSTQRSSREKSVKILTKSETYWSKFREIMVSNKMGTNTFLFLDFTFSVWPKLNVCGNYMICRLKLNLKELAALLSCLRSISQPTSLRASRNNTRPVCTTAAPVNAHCDFTFRLDIIIIIIKDMPLTYALHLIIMQFITYTC
jgi:hypothetical protein